MVRTRWWLVGLFGLVACVGPSVEPGVAAGDGVVGEVGGVAGEEEVVLRAGAGELHIRFELGARGLVARGEMWNPNAEPIWWRGGSELFCSEDVIAPEGPGGEVLRPRQFVIRCGDPGARLSWSERVARWRIEPGERVAFQAVLVEGTEPPGASLYGGPMLEPVAPERLHRAAALFPCWWATEEAPVKWNWMARSRDLLLAWERDGAEIARFVSREDTRMGHYDPFDATPWFRDVREIPFVVGPLRGTMAIRPAARGQTGAGGSAAPTTPAVVVDWSLRCVSDEAVRFRLCDPARPSWELERVAHPRGDVAQLRRRGVGEVTRRDGQGLRASPSASQPDRWEPGETRQGTLRIEGVDLRDGQWQARIPALWPTVDSGDPVQTTLHLVWDARYGFDATVALPFVSETDRWAPFVRAPSRSASASFDFAGLPAVVAGPGMLHLAELHVLARTQKPTWLHPGAYEHADFTDGTPVWLRAPGITPRTTVTLHTLPRLQTQSQPHSLHTDRRVLEGELRSGRLWWFDDSGLDPAVHGERGVPPEDDWTPWHCLAPVALPRHDPPSHRQDYPLAWLEIQWSPDSGYQARLASTPPGNEANH